MPRKCMVYHGDVEKALRNIRKSMQHECRIVNKKEFHRKRCDIKREIRVSLAKRLKKRSTK